MKPALIVIDIQNEYLPYMDQQDKERAMALINQAIDIFREHGHPVIRVNHTDPVIGPAVGSEGFQYPESVHVLAEDAQVIKNYPNAFKKTNLEEILKEKDCNTIFLCGLSATGCVLATYYGGRERNLNTFMIKDAVFSPKAEYTDMIEDISRVMKLNNIEFMLRHLPTE